MSVYSRLGSKEPPSNSRGSWRGGSRGRGGGGGDRGGGSGVHPRSRLEDDEGGFHHGQPGPQFGAPRGGRGRRRFTPYGNRPNRPDRQVVFDDSSEGGDRGSVFDRLGGGGGGGGGGSGGGGGGGQPRGPVAGRPTPKGEEGWFKVTLPSASQNSTQWLINQLQGTSGVPLEPHEIHTKGDKVMFFINDSMVADSLKEISGRVHSKTGPIKVIVRPSDPPLPRKGMENGVPQWSSHSGRPSHGGGVRESEPSSLDGDVSMSSFERADQGDRLKEALGHRYSPADKSLNLSNMYNDPTLNEARVRPIMYKQEYVSPILQLIKEYCPDLVSLDLSNNRISNLSLYSTLPLAAPNLLALDLSGNSIRRLTELDHLAGCSSLRQLFLMDNPAVGYYKDFTALAGEVRKIFPNLEVLNGEELAKPVKFSVPDVTQLPTNLPPVQGSYTVNSDVSDLIVQCIRTYYSMYDAPNREALYQGYSEKAYFTMSVMQSTQGPPGPKLIDYFHSSRNFIRLSDPVKRNSLVHCGRADIVKALRGLPCTSHILNSFTVDVLVATPTSTVFTITGAFIEVPPAYSGASDVLRAPIRCFSRTFGIIPAGNGMEISNDQMTIWNPSPSLEKKLRVEAQSAPGGANTLSSIPTHPQPQQLAFGQQPASGGAVQLQFGGGGGAVGGVPVGVGQSTMAQALVPGMAQMAGGYESTLESHPALVALSQEQKVLVVRLSQVTGMNLKYSAKCLQDNAFNYDKALEGFKLIGDAIPLEAFVRDC